MTKAVRDVKMGCGCFLVSALFAPAVWSAAPKSADEFQNPELIEVKAPGGDLTIRARQGTAFVPGLGEVEQVSGYDVQRGTTFKREGAKPRSVPLMPAVIAVERGSTLRILFRNELLATDVAGRSGPTETNLHTHGLIVSPKGTGFQGAGRDRAYGDCVFVAASTLGAASGGEGHLSPKPGAGDPCSLDAGSPFMRQENGDIRYSYVIPRDHLSGMYWFHPHPHRLSEVQVSNGLSGLMSIGSFWDYSYLKCRLTALPDEGPDTCRDQEEQREELALERHAVSAAGSLKVRFLGLKDIQVSKLKAKPGQGDKPRFRMIQFPQRPDPKDRSAGESFGEQTDARKNRCGKLVVSTRDGEVAYTDGVASAGQCWSKQHPDQRWVFTVSGQMHPRITVRPGKAELWHLANIGADVSYRLRLETIEAKPRRLAFDARSLDGAPLPREKQDRKRTETVLMPGARIDVQVERCSQAGGTSTPTDTSDCVEASQTVQARLYTAGVATGIDAESGDQWPPIDLASVVFEAAPPDAVVTPQPISGLMPRLPLSEQTIPDTQPRRVPVGQASTPVSSAAPSTCDARRYQTGPADFRLDSNLVRLIRFNNRDFGEHGGELFGIHVENFPMVDQTGKAVAVADLVAEGRTPRKAKSPSAIGSISLDDPCWRAAVGEHADPAEFARFYPSFRMDRDPNLTAAYGAREYWLLVNDSDECHNFHIHQSKFVVLDADFSAAEARPSAIQCLGDRGFVPPVNRGMLHDNYPLPPRSRVFVMLQFEGPKLGRFVFHCHILEHEDGGMMNIIRVQSADVDH